MSNEQPNGRGGVVRRSLRFALFRDGWFSIRELVPNFFTLLSICCGLVAIRWAIEREFEWAIAAVVVSVILDGIDGRMARFLDAQSKFGAEFDSLADFVSFGVAPAILIFNWSLLHLSGIGWAAVTLFALACGVRLARFNATIERKRETWEQDYFTGIPAPAGAIVVMLPLYLDGLRSTGDLPLPGFASSPWIPWAIIVYTVTIAFMMVSTIPTFAGKHTSDRLIRNYPMVLMVLGAVTLCLLLLYPYSTLATGTVLYLLAIPLGIRRFLQLNNAVAGDDALAASYSNKAGE